MLTEKEKIIENYTSGDCYQMAVALSRELDWKIGALVVDAIRKSSHVESWPHLVHVYVISPDGQFFDASGFQTEEYFLNKYMYNNKQEVSNIRFEEFSHDDFLRTINILYGGPHYGIEYDKDVYLNLIPSSERGFETEILIPTMQETIDAIEKLDLISQAQTGTNLMRKL